MLNKEFSLSSFGVAVLIRYFIMDGSRPAEERHACSPALRLFNPSANGFFLVPSICVTSLLIFQASYKRL